MKSTILIALLLLFLLACNSKEPVVKIKVPQKNPESGCFCSAQYDPVCGNNGVTYSNGCRARCDKVTDFVKGVCNPN